MFERLRVVTLPEGRAPTYFCFTDPAGGGGQDSWTTATAHTEGEQTILNALLEIRPPFSTADAAERVAQFAHSYGLTSVRGDRYAGRWPADALGAHGIGYEESPLTRSDIYRECIPLFSASRVRLLDNQRLATQFKLLERRVQPGGRDSIDHGRGGHEDCANSVAGALLLASHSARTLISAAGFFIAPGDSSRDPHIDSAFRADFSGFERSLAMDGKITF